MHTETIFDEAYLTDSGSSAVTRVTSHAVAPSSQSVVLQATAVNAAGNRPAVTFVVEGSYDGHVWLTSGLSGVGFALDNLDTEAPKEGASTAFVDVDYAYLRVRATVTSNDNAGEVIFSANLVFSHQE